MLGTAVLLLLLGETVLAERLRHFPWFALVYWLSCFGFVFAAILVALLDWLIVHKRSKAEHRHLIKETWENIASQQDDRKPPGSEAP